MTLYNLMDKLDTLQPQIETYGNAVVIAGLTLLGIFYFSTEKSLTHSWSKASKLMFTEEIKKGG